MDLLTSSWSLAVPRVLVCIAPLPVSLPSEDDALPPLIDRSEWEEFATEKRRIEHLGGRLLLAQALKAWWGPRATLLHVDEVEVRRDDHRAPHVHWMPGTWRREPLPSVSIAHSTGLAAVALASPGWRLGVDVEPADRVIASNAWDFFAGEEERTAFDGPQDALHAWVCKEAVQKALGLGMHLNPRTIRVGVDGFAHVNGARLEVKHLEHEGLLVGLALVEQDVRPNDPEDRILDATRKAIETATDWSIGCSTQRRGC
jgi:phosphopantetheinyl transferase (holo-ACP synthase)